MGRIKMRYFFVQTCCGPSAIETPSSYFPLGGTLIALAETMGHIPSIHFWEEISQEQFIGFNQAVAYLKNPSTTNTPNESAKIIDLNSRVSLKNVNKPPNDPTQGA